MTSIAPDLDRTAAVVDAVITAKPKIVLAERVADGAVGLLAAVLEAGAIAALWGQELLSLGAVLAVHAVCAALLWWWLSYRRAHALDLAGPQLLLLMTLATGPFGAVIAALSALMPARPADERQLLEAWYDRIARASGVDDDTQLADGIAVGRTIDLSKTTGPSFVDVMRGADIKAQQTVLGLIARTFKPEYVPALKLALKSREPIIRVQAAAVATRIRPALVDIVARARTSIATGAAAADRLTAHRHVALALESGLLDTADQLSAKDVVKELNASITDPVSSFYLRSKTVRATTAIARLAPTVRHEIENRLVSTRRFGELRRMRKIVMLGAGRLYRVRAMPRPNRALAAHPTGADIRPAAQLAGLAS